jgi:hypothetical protein
VLPIHMGSKLLTKCTHTECEFFNQKILDFLDKMKKMEDGYKLADPASMTLHSNYTSLGPIGILAWVRRGHVKFVRDHEWSALTTKLPGSNNEMDVTPFGCTPRTTMTCFHCGEDGHIKPKCPKLKVPQKAVVSHQKTENE